MLFGTFENPRYFEPDAGFYPGASKRVIEMLVGVHVAAQEPEQELRARTA